MDERVADSFRASTGRWLLGSFAGWLTLLSCLVGVGLVIVAIVWLRNASTRYEITNQRLIVHRGILMKSTDEVELFRIKDVRVDYSLLNQLTDIGTITITSSDPTTHGATFAMPFIPKARRRREGLRQLINAARQRGGVREVDMGMETY